MRPGSVSQPRQRQMRRELDLGRRHKPDYGLLILTAILLAIGLIVVYAISPALSAANHVSTNYYVGKQLIAIGLSLVALIVTAQIPLNAWRMAYKPLLWVAGIVTLAALVMPVNPAYPAHRWVRLGTFSFQSVELAKFAVMIWLAGFLAEQIRRGQVSDTNATLKPIMIALLAFGLVVAGVQSDLGSTGVMVAMMAAMAFVGGLPFKRILQIGGIILIGLILSVSAIPYRRARLEAFLHPQSNCQGSGYQACQALISVGSGGIAGLGLGSGAQAYGYQPEAANDSIFAIYAEKFGFVGSVLLLGVFVAFFARLKSIAERLTDDFSRLIVVGVLTWLSVQMLINVGGMIGLLPLKGITLPFISYGGTSVVFAAAAIGLVFQASAYTSYRAPHVTKENRRSGYDDRPDRRRLRGAYHPDLSSRG